MKKIILLLFVFSITLTAQQNSIKSILELKNQISINDTDQNEFLLLNEPQKKSPFLAVVYSLLLPGMGELYGGDYSLGKYFTIADAVFWGGFIGFNVYGNNQEDNYKSFARSKGEANLEGKDDQYYADISEFINIEDYNNDKAKTRQFDLLYDTETHNWNWGDNKTRSEYRGIWSKSENAFNNVRFAVGALILNRIVSSINAVRVVSAFNKKQSESLSWNVSVNVKRFTHTMPSSLNLYLTTSF